MARKKSSGKSTALSQEYIIDSDSDASADAPSSVEKGGNPSNQSSPQSKKQKKDRILSKRNISQVENIDSDGIIGSEKETTTASPSPSESSSDEGLPENGGKSRAIQLPQKRKTASRYRFY